MDRDDLEEIIKNEIMGNLSIDTEIKQGKENTLKLTIFLSYGDKTISGTSLTIKCVDGNRLEIEK